MTARESKREALVEALRTFGWGEARPVPEPVHGLSERVADAIVALLSAAPVGEAQHTSGPAGTTSGRNGPPHAADTTTSESSPEPSLTSAPQRVPEDCGTISDPPEPIATSEDAKCSAFCGPGCTHGITPLTADERAQLTALRSQLSVVTRSRDEWRGCAEAAQAERDEVRARLEEATRELEEAHAENSCDACGGDGQPTSGLACMCGGAGTMSAAARHLREQLTAAESRVAELEETVQIVSGARDEARAELERTRNAHLDAKAEASRLLVQKSNVEDVLRQRTEERDEARRRADDLEANAKLVRAAFQHPQFGQSCERTYMGGYSSDRDLDVFRHGMHTVCNVVHAELDRLSIVPLPEPPAGAKWNEPVPIHSLKTWPGPFAAVRDGSKLFEYRKNDRGFAVGHVLRLQEWSPAGGYTYQEILVRVTYLTSDAAFGIPAGYCVMGIRPLPEDTTGGRDGQR